MPSRRSKHISSRHMCGANFNKLLECWLRPVTLQTTGPVRASPESTRWPLYVTVDELRCKKGSVLASPPLRQRVAAPEPATGATRRYSARWRFALRRRKERAKRCGRKKSPPGCTQLRRMRVSSALLNGKLGVLSRNADKVLKTTWRWGTQRCQLREFCIAQGRDVVTDVGG